MGFKDAARTLLGALLFFAAAVMAGPVLARTVLELDDARQPVPLLDAGDAWIDATGAAGVEDVAGNAALPWQPTHEDAIYRLSTGKALWIRFTVPASRDTERWYLEVPYPSVDRVTPYMRDAGGRWIAQAAAGDTIAVADWPVPHRYPLLPVALSPDQPRDYLLRVENPHSYSAPLAFINESYMSRHEQRTSLILGIYFGLAGLAAVLGVLSAVSLRDKAYALYAISVALMGLAQGAMTGIAGMHLWPTLPWWNDRSSMALPVLAIALLICFFSSVVSMRQRSLLLHRLLALLAVLGVLTALGILLIEPSRRMGVMVAYIVVATSVGLLAVVWAARRGDRYAVWLLAGCAPVALGAIFPTARLAGLIPSSFWTLHGMQVGIAIELPVLLLILMMRSQQRREHNRRIHALERIDPATGLINAHVFTERLARMMARSERLKYRSAVLLVDIVNIEQVRHVYGQLSAEELPLRVAGRLLSAAREIDTVARLAELRFGVLVEGPLSSEDAASEGPRLVARCLMPFRNKPIDWVARVRVAQTLVPTERADAAKVLERLEGLLAAVSPESKRAVFTLTS